MNTYFDCDAVLFDLDGVLANSQAVIDRIWQKWTAEHGIDYAQLIAVSHGVRAIDTIRRFAPWLDAPAQAARLLAQECQDLDGVVPIPGSLELLKSLPVGRWAVATSGDRPLATARLTHIGAPLPNIMVTAEDVVNGKPYPDPYLLAAKRLGVDPQRCIVIEDAPAGIAAGKAAGARVIGVTTNYTPDHLTQADAVVRNLADLQCVLTSGLRIVVQLPQVVQR